MRQLGTTHCYGAGTLDDNRDIRGAHYNNADRGHRGNIRGAYDDGHAPEWAVRWHLSKRERQDARSSMPGRV